MCLPILIFLSISLSLEYCENKIQQLADCTEHLSLPEYLTFKRWPWPQVGATLAARSFDEGCPHQQDPDDDLSWRPCLATLPSDDVVAGKVLDKFGFDPRPKYSMRRMGS